MKINIYYESKIYSTTIKNPIPANILIDNIKYLSNQKTQNFKKQIKKQIPKKELNQKRKQLKIFI